MTSGLFLDFGTNTGFAIVSEGVLGYVGKWVLSKPKEITYARKLRMHRRLDPRIPALWNQLAAVYCAGKFDWLVWEDVEFCSTSFQCQLWSSFRTTAWIFAQQHGINTECLPVGSLKKFATGSGKADKTGMILALARQDSRFSIDNGKLRDTLTDEVIDDNAVDAIFLAKWGMRTLE